jgi:hypothetical protein
VRALATAAATPAFEMSYQAARFVPNWLADIGAIAAAAFTVICPVVPPLELPLELPPKLLLELLVLLPELLLELPLEPLLEPLPELLLEPLLKLEPAGTVFTPPEQPARPQAAAVSNSIVNFKRHSIAVFFWFHVANGGSDAPCMQCVARSLATKGYSTWQLLRHCQ